MKAKEIVIKISKVKILGLVAICIGFIVLGIWMAFYAPTTKIEFLNNDIFRKSIGILSITFFGVAGLIIARRLFDHKYGIKISDEGVHDNSTSINSGLIAWENIEKIEKRRVFSERFIQIRVKNPNDFVQRQKNILARKTVETNLKKHGSPIQISANGLQIGFNELYSLLSTEFGKRK